MNHRRVNKEDEGQVLSLQAWGYEKPMTTPPVEMHVTTVVPTSDGGMFETREQQWVDRGLSGICSRLSANWRVVS